MLTNPTVCEIDLSPDHTQLTNYVLQFWNSTGALVGNVNVPIANTTIVGNRVRIPAGIGSIQSLPFDIYTTVAIAQAGLISSDPSDPTPAWKRAPGKPTNAVMVAV